MRAYNLTIFTIKIKYRLCEPGYSKKSINRTTSLRGGWEGEDQSNINRSKTCFCPETRHWYKPSKWLQIQKYSAILSSSILGNKSQVLWWWTANGNVLQHSYWINSLTSKRVRLTEPRAALRQEELTVKCLPLVGRKLRVSRRSDWKQKGFKEIGLKSRDHKKAGRHLKCFSCFIWCYSSIYGYKNCDVGYVTHSIIIAVVT